MTTPVIKLPEEILDRLRQVRGGGDAEFWEVGRIALMLEEDSEGNPKKQKAIRAAIADTAGLAPKTVAEYKSAAAMFPPQFVEQPGFELFTRWHYREAKRLKSMKVIARVMDEWSRRSGQYGGNPIPIRVARAEVSEMLADPDDPVLDPYEDMLDTLEKALEYLVLSRDKLASYTEDNALPAWSVVYTSEASRFLGSACQELQMRTRRLTMGALS